MSAFELFLFLMHRDELVGIQTIWWVDYQLAVGFLTGSWKSNLDVWISNHLFGNPIACLSWPRCSGVKTCFYPPKPRNLQTPRSVKARRKKQGAEATNGERGTVAVVV